MRWVQIDLGQIRFKGAYCEDAITRRASLY